MYMPYPTHGGYQPNYADQQQNAQHNGYPENETNGGPTGTPRPLSSGANPVPVQSLLTNSPSIQPGSVEVQEEEQQEEVAAVKPPCCTTGTPAYGKRCPERWSPSSTGSSAKPCSNPGPQPPAANTAWTAMDLFGQPCHRFRGHTANNASSPSASQASGCNGY